MIDRISKPFKGSQDITKKKIFEVKGSRLLMIQIERGYKDI